MKSIKVKDQESGKVYSFEVTKENFSSLFRDLNIEIAPTAAVGKNVTIGNNSNIKHDTEISKNVTIGDFVEIEANVLISKNCNISNMSAVGFGTYLHKNVKVGQSVIIGKHCIIKESSKIQSSVEIKDGVTLGCCSYIGPNTTILQGVFVPDSATIPANMKDISYVAVYSLKDSIKTFIVSNKKAYVYDDKYAKFYKLRHWINVINGHSGITPEGASFKAIFETIKATNK